MTTKAVIAMASLALMFGLGALLWLVGAFAFLPSERAVARAFTESHPELRVARVIPGRGDEDGFNFKIHYPRPELPKSGQRSGSSSRS